MSKSKLTTILATLTEQELHQLNQFAASPLYNSGKRPHKVQALLNYLSKFHPDFKGKKLMKEMVFNAIFPNDVFNKSKLDKLYSEAVKLIRIFIATKQNGQEAEQLYWLKQAHFFQDRKLDTEFKHAANKLESLLKQNLCEPLINNHHQLILEIEKTKFSLRQNDKKGDLNLPSVLRSLDLFYFITKMEYCSYYLAQGNHTNLSSTQPILLLEEVLNAVKENYLGVPAAAAYFYIFPILERSKEQEIDKYQTLKTVLEKHAHNIPKSTFKTLHNHMRSYLAYRYNQGENLILQDLFDLFKDQIKQGSIYQDGHHILSSTLQNAITVAIKLGEYSWAINFLVAHKDRINGPDNPMAIFEFHISNIYFHQKHYQKAYDKLPQYHYKEAFYNLAVRRLDIKLTYELDISIDLLEYRLKALKSFIHEHKNILPPDKFIPNNNFIKLLFQIFNILKKEGSQKSSHSKKKTLSQKVEKVIQKLQDEKSIAEREWLLEKLKNILSKKL